MAYADLTGRVAIVTGGVGALGRATNTALLEAGATVVTTDRSMEGMRDLAASLPEAHRPRLTTVQADIATEEGAASVLRHATETHGGVDILVNIVGGYAGGPSIAETDVGTWHAQFEMNATTAFLMAKATIPAMEARGWGRIINVSSRVALSVPAGLSAYAVSKSAVLALTGVLANETREHGITANAVLPSVIDTHANRLTMPDADFDIWVKPEQIAAVIRFLASSEAGIISGAAIPVYGRA